MVISGIGMYQASQAQRKQGDFINSAISAQKPQLQAQHDILSSAEGFDPATQDRQAFSLADQNASSVLARALSGVTGGSISGGGSPTGDTGVAIASQGAANRVLDPLRTWAAEHVATEGDRKREALASVFRAPAGQISNTYFDAASAMGPRADMSGSIGGMMKALQGLPGFGGGAVGPGGANSSGREPGSGTVPSTPSEGFDPMTFDWQRYLGLGA